VHGVDRSMQSSLPADDDRFLMHGTTIAIMIGAEGHAEGLGDAQPAWVAAMICGPSGSGKSDLALRCLAQPLNAIFPASTLPLGVRLVADDQTDLIIARAAHAKNAITARPPVSIAGLLEVRGLGIIAVPHVTAARLILVVDLVTAAEVQRYPADDWTQFGPATNAVELPHYQVAPFEASSPLKLLLALARTALTGSPVGADAAKHHCLPEGQ
jgi:HPr kinase/phosphorylase